MKIQQHTKGRKLLSVVTLYAVSYSITGYIQLGNISICIFRALSCWVKITSGMMMRSLTWVKPGVPMYA